MQITSRRAFLLALASALTACAAATTPTSPPTATAPPKPTSPPPSPTSLPVTPTAVPATATPPPATATPVPPTATAVALRRFVVGEGSKTTLRVTETFANVRVPSDAVLTTSAMSGQLSIGPDGRFGPDSRVVVDLSTLQSDDSDRDDHIKEDYLETAKFRDAKFVPKEFRGLPSPQPASGPIRGQVLGDLTIHGVTKPVTFEVDGVVEEGTVRATAKTEVKITDFDMEVPTLAILLSVEDRVRAEIELVATEQRA